MTQATLILTAPPAPVEEARPEGPSTIHRELSPLEPGLPMPAGALKSRFRTYRPPLWLLAILGVSALAAAYVYVPRLYAVETDDAQLQADTVSIVPKVAAYVAALHVDDNTSFKAGQLLLELDPRDFDVAVQSAAADLQGAQAAQASVQAQLAQQNQVIDADTANLAGDRSKLDFAQQQLDRFGSLAQTGFGTTQRWQQAQSDYGSQQAVVQRDSATLAAARTQLDVLKSQEQQAEATAAHADAALAQAKLNLSYTKIYAPTDGTVAARTVQAGDFVQPGQTLFSAVPDTLYVIANFKETQLTQMRAGQPVKVAVDAFPGLALHGHIDSFQRGTGSNFALLPPDNATGNFVKVVQRVPVKILLDEGRPLPQLAPGMSVEATVILRQPPGWLAWLL